VDVIKKNNAENKRKDKERTLIRMQIKLNITLDIINSRWYTITTNKEIKDMKLLEDFEKAKQALYDHVGFVEDWTVYPIDDRTDMFWTLDETEKCIRYADSIEALNSDGDYYENEIYKQRFYNKWIYRGEKLTMIIVNTHTDGNCFFAFYDNEKEVL
jgi:hypothetical protein